MLSDEDVISRKKMHDAEDHKNGRCSTTGTEYQPQLGSDGKYYCSICGKPVETNLSPLSDNFQRRVPVNYKKLPNLL
jgi:hypothetical protein